MTAAVSTPEQGRTTSSGPARRRTAPGRVVWLSLGLVLALGLLLLVVGLSLTVGTNQLPLSTVWRLLRTPDGSFESNVIDSRISRTILGVLVGAALAVAGALMQGITRNPLADPGLLGVNAGASAAVVLGTLVFGGLGQRAIVLAIPGAFIAAVLVYAIGSGRSGPTPVRLVLAGAAVTAVLGALIQALTLSNSEVFDSYRFWVVGSLAGRPDETIQMIWPVVVAGLVAGLMLGRPLNTLALGDETAKAVGGNAGRTRLLGALVATALAGAATAAVGPIVFVGLAVPHIVRSVTGSDYRWLVAYCVMLGPALLVAADVVGRVVVRPGELMVGVVTAFVGAPFLYLAVRRSGSGM